MKLGAEPKKVAILAPLGLVAAYTVYTNLIAGGAAGGPPPAARAQRRSPAAGIVEVAQQATPPAASAAAPPAPRRAARENVQEWTPSLKPRRPEDRLDPAKVDTRLRLDLLARLQNITYAGAGTRSLFDFSSALPPKVPDIKIVPKKGAPGKAGTPPVETAVTPDGPKPPEALKAPPVPLKFYGFVSSRDGRRGFFLNGDEIFTAAEGQVIQSRYRVVRLGLNSAIVSDTKFTGHQQTLALEEPPAGS